MLSHHYLSCYRTFKTEEGKKVLTALEGCKEDGTQKLDLSGLKNKEVKDGNKRNESWMMNRHQTFKHRMGVAK